MYLPTHYFMQEDKDEVVDMDEVSRNEAEAAEEVDSSDDADDDDEDDLVDDDDDEDNGN